MDSTAVAPEGGRTTNWRTLVIVGVMALVAWWVWRRTARTKPEVAMTPNATAPPQPPAGIPLGLAEKIARVVDTQIPVVMTSGASVPYDEDEINRMARTVLGKLNAMDESVSLVGVASVSKTQDSYKTVSYDLILNAYDARNNVGLMLSVSTLVPVSGKLYVRKFSLFHTKDDDSGPGPASEPAGHAAYQSPLQALANTKLG